MKTENFRRHDLAPNRQLVVFALIGWANAIVVRVIWDSVNADEFAFSIGTVVRLIGMAIGLYLGWPLIRKRSVLS